MMIYMAKSYEWMRTGGTPFQWKPPHVIWENLLGHPRVVRQRLGTTWP